MTKKKTILKDLRFNEVSNVDSGANQYADVVLWKRYEDPVNEEKDPRKNSKSKAERDKVKTVNKLSGGGSMPEQDVVEVAKAEELQKRLVDLEKRAADAETELRKERDIRLDREFSDKAAEYTVPGLSKVELKDLLKAVASDEGASDKLNKLLKTVTQAQKHNNVLMKSIGNQGVDQTDAQEEMQTMIKMAMKENPNLNLADATLKIGKENPGLYERYQWERTMKARMAI